MERERGEKEGITRIQTVSLKSCVAELNELQCCRQDRTNRDQDSVETREYRGRDKSKTLCVKEK